MKSGQKIKKLAYNQPLVKLRAEIIKEKVQKAEYQSQSSSSEQNNSLDQEVEQFANQFYDTAVKKADQQKIIQDSNLIDNEQKKVKKKKETKLSQINKKLKQIKNNPDLDWNMIMFKKKDERKLKQIAEFLSKKHLQRKNFKKKLKKILTSQKQRIKIEQQMLKKRQQQVHMNKLKQIRKISLQIKKKMEKNKIQSENKLQQVEQFYQKFHSKYTNKKLYKLMQISDRKRQNRQVQKQKFILKERCRHNNQSLRLQDMNEFSRIQSQRLRDIITVKQSQKNQRLIDISEKNKQLREKIYIGHQYQKIQQEQIEKEKLKNKANQKLKKIKNYQNYVKQNFLPINNNNDDQNQKQDQYDQNNEQTIKQKQKRNKEEEIIQINGRPYKKVKKIRYLKGEEVGSKYINIPIPQTESELKRQGNSYLEQMKLIPKKRHSTSLDLSKLSSGKKSSASTSFVQIPKVIRKLGKINLHKNASRQQIDNLINSLKAKDEMLQRKQKYFKLHSPKGSNPEKEDLDVGLFDNIEKKINLLGRL